MVGCVIIEDSSVKHACINKKEVDSYMSKDVDIDMSWINGAMQPSDKSDSVVDDILGEALGSMFEETKQLSVLEKELEGVDFKINPNITREEYEKYYFDDIVDGGVTV